MTLVRIELDFSLPDEGFNATVPFNVTNRRREWRISSSVSNDVRQRRCGGADDARARHLTAPDIQVPVLGLKESCTGNRTILASDTRCKTGLARSSGFASVMRSQT